MKLLHYLSYLLLPIIALVGALGATSTDTQCPVAPTVPADRRLDVNRFRLVQYNVEWLFIDQYNGCPGSSCTWANQSEANTHLDWVVNVLDDLDGDYINFCEIEGCDELNMLKSLTNSAYNPYLIKGTDSSTGQNVGVLTKIDPVTNLLRNEDRASYPIPGSTCGYTGNVGSSGVSKHYYTTFDINKTPVAIVGAHLLAYPTDSSRCASREAQALVLQETIYSLVSQGYELIVLGDLNDYDGEVLDINSHKPISQVLEILKGNAGTFAGKYNLIPVSQQIPQSERYTEWWDENANCNQDKSDLSMIDHILVSSNLYKKISNVFAYHGYTQYCNTYNSDHWPVVVDFDFSKQ
jgi:exonuclease III